MFFFPRKEPKNVLEGLDRAQKLLDDRFSKQLISLSDYQKQCLKFQRQREKYEKQFGIQKYDV